MIALVVKNLAANAGDTRDAGSIPAWGRSPGGGNGNPLQYSCLENSMDRGAWRATVHGATKSQTQLRGWAHKIYSLSDFLYVQIYFLYSKMIQIRTNQRETRTCIGQELEGPKFIAFCAVPVKMGHLTLLTTHTRSVHLDAHSPSGSTAFLIDLSLAP